MTKYNSKASLFNKIRNDLIYENTSKEITADMVDEAFEALYDTIGEDWLETANLTSFGNLSLETDFKEYDICVVNDIGEGDRIGVYRYIRTRTSGTLEWHLIAKLGSQKFVLTAENSVANYISNDYTNGDLAQWDMVKLTTGQIYIITAKNGTYYGDNASDYQNINVTFNALTYQGTWNANTNTPTLASGTGTQGHYYVVSTAGTTNLDGITDWQIGDWAVFNGTVWEKLDNSWLSAVVDDTTPQLGGDLDTNRKRIKESQGDDVASANNLSLTGTNNGNLWEITGTTQVNLIDSSQWSHGSVVRLLFSSALTFKDGQTSSGNFKKVNLGGADITTVAGQIVTLSLRDNDEWYIVSDSVASGGGGSGGHTISENDIDLTARTNLNFVTNNSEDVVTDDSGNDATDVAMTVKSMNDYDASNEYEGGVMTWCDTTKQFLQQEQEEDDRILYLTQSNISADGQLTIYLPAGYLIEHIFVFESSSNAAGNVSLGTAASGTQIVNAYTVGSDEDSEMTLVAGYFSKTADTDIYVSSSAWGSGVIDLMIVCKRIW